MKNDECLTFREWERRYLGLYRRSWWRRGWDSLKQIRIRIHWKLTWTLLAAVALFFTAEWVMMQRYEPVGQLTVYDRLANRYCGFNPQVGLWICTPSIYSSGGTNAR